MMAMGRLEGSAGAGKQLRVYFFLPVLPPWLQERARKVSVRVQMSSALVGQPGSRLQ